MSYFDYHGTIRKRIRQGELITYDYVEEYNGISPCLLLRFSTKPFVKPIREKMWDEYEKLFKK